MATATDFVEYTPEDLLNSEREARYELVDGQLLEKPSMGARSNHITTNLVLLLGTFVRQGKLGLCFTQECGYQIFANDPRKVRFPDISFVRAGRLPGDEPPDGHMRIVPDLVVEVVSPNDKVVDLDARLTDYRKAGVPLLWVIYPGTRHIHVFRADKTALWLDEDDELTGEGVVPGFACLIKDLFVLL